MSQHGSFPRTRRLVPGERPRAHAGRPPAASRELLQEAAFELFQRHGYAGVTVDRIARAAGVSRATFFNYFEAKSDVFWVEVDDIIDQLADAVQHLNLTNAGLRDLQTLTLRMLGGIGGAAVPWALTNASLLGDVTDLHASALRRVQVLTTAVATAPALRGATMIERRSIANTLIGALIAAVLTWAEAGIGRGPLGPYLEAAFEAIAN